jgi:CheY-like chemotaxis protein
MRKKALVVDDISLIREGLGLMMEELGFSVLLAANGIEALDILEKESVDCILTDLNMPEMNGIQAVQKIRESDNDYNNLPIFAFSAFTSQATREKCFLAGVNELLFKPINKSKLRKTLDQWDLSRKAD